MLFDNLCKLLSEKYPDNFANWVLGTPQTTAKVLKTELSIEQEAGGKGAGGKGNIPFPP